MNSHNNSHDQTLLQIKLRRRYGKCSSNKNKPPTFRAIGYFNEIYIEEVKKFKHLFIDKEGSIDLDTEAEIQYLYLGGAIHSTKKGGFNKAVLGHDTKHPLFAITGIKLGNKRLVEDRKISHPISLTNIILETIEESLQGITAITELFHGVGFCDYFIIWRASDFKHIMNALINMRKRFSLDDEFYLDFIYTVPGYQPSYAVADIDIDFQMTKMSLIPTMEYTKSNIQKNEMRYAIFGSHDFVYINEKTKINALDNIIGYAIDKESIEGLSNSNNHSNDKAQALNEIITKLACADMGECLSHTHLIELRNLALFFKSMENSHALDRQLLNEWIAITEKFELLASAAFEEFIKNDNDPIVDESGKIDFSAVKEVGEYAKSFEIGIENINEFVRSWVKGSKANLESPIQSIHHTGGISKITHFYTLIIGQIEDHFTNAAISRGIITENEAATSSYQFFIVPSWKSLIASHYIFKGLRPAYGRLIPIKLPIEDYFDFRKIGLLFHELGHYYPSNRRIRNGLILDLVASDIAYNLADYYFFELLEGAEEDRNSFNNDISFVGEIKKELVYSLVEQIEICIKPIISEYFLELIGNGIDLQISKFCEVLLFNLQTIGGGEINRVENTIKHYERKKRLKKEEKKILEQTSREKERVDDLYSNIAKGIKKSIKKYRKDCLKTNLPSSLFNDSSKEELMDFRIEVLELSEFMSKNGLRPDQEFNKTIEKVRSFFRDSIRGRDYNETPLTYSYNELIEHQVKNHEETFKELKADYFMCKILNLSREQYHCLLDEMSKRNYRYRTDISPEVIEDQKNTRKDVLEVIGGFSPLEDSVKEVDWIEEIAKTIQAGMPPEELADLISQPIIGLCSKYIQEDNDMSSLDLLITVLNNVRYK